MKLMRAGKDVVASIGPILDGLIRGEGYTIKNFAKLTGIKPEELVLLLRRQDLSWSVMNKILRPLGFHFVIERKQDASEWEIKHADFPSKNTIQPSKANRARMRIEKLPWTQFLAEE
jgi:hypothetical protein